MSKGPKSEDKLFLRKRKDIERVKRQGQRLQTPLFNLMFCEVSHTGTKVGVVVGRRLGKAVVRNRAKRIFKELVRATQHELLKGRNIIVFPKSQALGEKHQAIRRSWKAALHHAGLVRPNPNSTWLAPSSFE